MNNEKWQGNSKPRSNSGAGRDGKPFEKRDVKSILKGARGATKFSTGKRDYSDHRTPEKNNSQSNTENRPATSEKRSFQLKNDRPSYERRPYESRDGERKPYERRDGERKPYERRDGERKPYERRDDRTSFGTKKPWETNENRGNGERKPWENRTDNRSARPRYNTDNDARPDKLTFRKPGELPKPGFVETRFDHNNEGTTYRKPLRKRIDSHDPNAKYSQKKQVEFHKQNIDPSKPVRLNKFLANAGICSRREADEFIKAGVISVNGQIVVEMGVKVNPTDKVMFHDQTIHSERKVYLLLNKPKDCVTTSEDTHDRLTVLDLVKNACSERIYPVGRLDRNTTGVLLLTNDGDLASKLTHPKFVKKKIYHATLDKPLEKDDFETIMSGIEFEDGQVVADALEFVKEDDLRQVGIEIHSGQNRIVRRIFEKLGYKVIRLDRVYFAGLTKKNLPRGKYRFLNEREINMLKMGAHE